MASAVRLVEIWLWTWHKKAVALDESLPEGHARLAWARLWRRQYDDAIAEGRRAIAIDPNYADGYLLLSHILIYAGEAEEGVEIAIEGMPLDPDLDVSQPDASRRRPALAGPIR